MNQRNRQAASLHALIAGATLAVCRTCAAAIALADLTIFTIAVLHTISGFANSSIANFSCPTLTILSTGRALVVEANFTATTIRRAEAVSCLTQAVQTNLSARQATLDTVGRSGADRALKLFADEAFCAVAIFCTNACNASTVVAESTGSALTVLCAGRAGVTEANLTATAIGKRAAIPGVASPCQTDFTDSTFAVTEALRALAGAADLPTGAVACLSTVAFDTATAHTKLPRTTFFVVGAR